MPPPRLRRRAEREVRSPESLGVTQAALRHRDSGERLVRVDQLQRVASRGRDLRLRLPLRFLPVLLRRGVLNLYRLQNRVPGKASAYEVEGRPRLLELSLHELRPVNSEVEVRDRGIQGGRTRHQTLGFRILPAILVDQREVVECTTVIRVALEHARVGRDGRL